MTLSLYAVPVLLTGVVAVCLAAVVVIRERVSVVSLTFLGVTITIGGWLLSYAAVYSIQDPDRALRWIRLANMHVAWIPTALYAMALAMNGCLWKDRVRVMVACVCSALFAALTLTTDVFVAGAYRYWWGYYPRYGWLSFPFLAFFGWLLTLSLRMYWVGYHAAPTTVAKRRMKGLAIAFGVAYLGSFDYLPAYGIRLYAFGYLPVFIFLVLAARVMWRYRLVEITSSFAAEQVMATMADALYVIDGDGIIRVANHQAGRIAHRPLSELIGASIAALPGAVIRPEQLAAVFQTHEPLRYEVAQPAANGLGRMFDVTASAVHGPADKPAAVVCIAREITGARLAAHTLRKLSSAVEQGGDSVIITDRSGIIEYVNPAFERLTGYRRGETVGKTPALLKSGQHPPEFYQAMWAAILGGQVFRGVLINRKKDGSLYHEEKTISPVRNEAGAITHFISSGQDITARHASEAQLATKVGELEQLNRLMIGREERILELKSEIRALKERPRDGDATSHA